MSDMDYVFAVARIRAKEKTLLSDAAGHLMRGYDHLDQKLQALGANVEKLPE